MKHIWLRRAQRASKVPTPRAWRAARSVAHVSCSLLAAVDILLLLDGSYSVGSSSFNDSKHFAGKLCDALDIDPDRVSVRNVSL